MADADDIDDLTQEMIDNTFEAIASDSEKLLVAVLLGSPMATDQECEAFYTWAAHVRTEAVLLSAILRGIVLPDITGMADPDDNFGIFAAGNLLKAAGRDEPQEPE